MARTQLTGQQVRDTSIGTDDVGDNAITNPKLADMAASTIKGRITSTGVPQDLTVAEVLTMLGVEAGATADQVASEVPFTATGNIAATNVQAAIAEVDTEKVAKAGDKMTGGLYGMIPSTASTMVGNEYNLLHNAHTRAGITITQTGTGLVPSTNSFFDGLLGPAYSSDGINPADPFVLTINGLPETHTQTGGVIGWTSRYWYPIRYKLEVYDIYLTSRWKTIVDTSGAGVSTKELLIPIYPTHSGQFTSIRLTVYQGGGSNGANGFPRWGISELFFVHPEAMSLYQYINADTVDGYHATALPVSTPQQTALDLKANSAITITPTAPLTGGGALSANLTLAISAATTSAAGSMSAADKAKLDRINEFYYVSYYVSGNVTLASWTPLTITNYAMFHSSNWPTTPSSGQFTIPVTGYYLVEATLTYIVTTTDHIYGLYIYLTSSGVEYEKVVHRVICANGGQQTFVTASAMLLLSAGETISMKALSSIATINALATNNGPFSNLNITLIRRTV